MATCCYNHAELYDLLDKNGRFLSEEAAKKIHDAGYAFLHCYVSLAKIASRQRRCLFNLVPKFHYVCHMLDATVRFRLNPRYDQCFAGEDFVRQIKNIMVKCHRLSVVPRALGRYKLRLAQRWTQRHRAARSRDRERRHGQNPAP